jgi:hypothetical protein
MSFFTITTTENAGNSAAQSDRWADFLRASTARFETISGAKFDERESHWPAELARMSFDPEPSAMAGQRSALAFQGLRHDEFQ